MDTIDTLTASLRQAEADLIAARHWEVEYRMAEEKIREARNEWESARERAECAHELYTTERAAREEAEQLAVWAAKHGVNLLPSVKMIAWNDQTYLGTPVRRHHGCDLTDAGILAALRRAMEGSSDGE